MLHLQEKTKNSDSKSCSKEKNMIAEHSIHVCKEFLPLDLNFHYWIYLSELLIIIYWISIECGL